MKYLGRLAGFRVSWAQLGLGLLAGALWALSYPPWDQSWPGFAALVLLARLAWKLNPAQAYVCGLAAGFVKSVATLYWLMVSMTQYGNVSWPLALVPLTIFCLILGCFPGFWAALVSRLRDKGISPILVGPPAWVASEWIQSWLLTGFPWLPLGHVWLPVPALVQSAEIWGVFGLSGLVVLYSMLLSRASLVHDRRPGMKEFASLAAALVLLAGAYVWGQSRMTQIQALSEKAPKLTVSAVQGNVPIYDMWRQNRHLPVVRDHVRLSVQEAEKVKSRPWLLVWSESSAPFFMVSEAKKTQPMLDFCKEYRASLVAGTMGSVYVDKAKTKIGMTNRSFLVDDKGRAVRYYDKVHLVPFGEYVPYDYVFFWVRALATVSENFTPGQQGSVIDYGPATLGPLICYESIFPELAREQRKRGAKLMINQTNDSWFGRTGASRQQMSHLILRSIENRSACVRSANSGVSAFIFPDGEVQGTTDLFVQAVVTRSVPLLDVHTLYTEYGHLVGAAGLGLTLGLALLAWVLGRRRRAPV